MARHRELPVEVDRHASTERRAGRASLRRATNVTLDVALLGEARALGVNVSQAAEVGLADAVARRRAEQWLVENREAVESSNSYVEAFGLPLARYRNF